MEFLLNVLRPNRSNVQQESSQGEPSEHHARALLQHICDNLPTLIQEHFPQGIPMGDAVVNGLQNQLAFTMGLHSLRQGEIQFDFVYDSEKRRFFLMLPGGIFRPGDEEFLKLQINLESELVHRTIGRPIHGNQLTHRDVESIINVVIQLGRRLYLASRDVSE